MTYNEYEVLVNMPNGSNILFCFRNNKIIRKSNKSFKQSKNAILFYNLTIAIQDEIFEYLNPKAIFNR
ncbi:MAG: hypothetical protein H6587_01985 [Flavobacteriales bacterium]|nr:hypothetical protein [Flavobacteriales bacterium]MCB9363315.1 hypothetical protein [Flavobacteriales bacterium]